MNSDGREIRKPSLDVLAGSILAKLLKREGFMRVMGAAAESILSDWAGKNRVRRRLSRIITRPLSLLFRRHHSRRNESGTTLAADLGILLTEYARHVNKAGLHQRTNHAREREGPLRDFIVQTDFGELKEMVERSEEHFVHTMENLNEIIWRYPGKVASILAVLPSLANCFLLTGREMLRPPKEKVGPDLLADLVLSLMKRIDPKEAAAFVNSVNECIRRLHTGSLLLSKGGTPLFEIYLTDMLKEGVPLIDGELYCKARSAIAEDGESLRNALTRTLEENPDMILAMLSDLSSLFNPAIRSRLRRLEMIEHLDVDDLAEAAGNGLAGLDTDDVAESINSALRVFNNLYDRKPELCSTLLSGVTAALDGDELQRAAERLLPETIEILQPVLRAAMPSLVRALCDMADPSAGHQSEEQREAFMRLRRLLNEGDGT